MFVNSLAMSDQLGVAADRRCDIMIATHQGYLFSETAHAGEPSQAVP